MNKLTFTGEFFIPGLTEARIEQDHFARYEFARKYVENKSVLDIACGFGYAGPILKDAGASSYHGVDINVSLIENAARLYGSQQISYEAGDACTFSTDKKFDVIISFETIEHIQNYKAALKTIQRNISPNGCIIISSPNRPVTSPKSKSISEKPENKFHTQEFTPNELLAEMKAAGISIKKAQIFGQRLSFFHFKHKLIRKILYFFSISPSLRASSKPLLFKFKKPQYFIIVAPQ